GRATTAQDEDGAEAERNENRARCYELVAEQHPQFCHGNGIHGLLLALWKKCLVEVNGQDRTRLRNTSSSVDVLAESWSSRYPPRFAQSSTVVRSRCRSSVSMTVTPFSVAETGNGNSTPDGATKRMWDASPATSSVIVPSRSSTPW